MLVELSWVELLIFRQWMGVPCTISYSRRICLRGELWICDILLSYFWSFVLKMSSGNRVKVCIITVMMLLCASPSMMRLQMYEIYLNMWPYLIRARVFCGMRIAECGKLSRVICGKSSAERFAKYPLSLFRIPQPKNSAFPHHSLWSYLLTTWLFGEEAYSTKKLKLRRVLQTLCGAFERCSRVWL